MVVSACGFGSSGSSVVCDYLLECNSVQLFDAFEFNLVTMEDGIEDLEYHLMNRQTKFVSGMCAIQRFRKAVRRYSHYWSKRTGVSKQDIINLTEGYINDITQLSFIGDTTITEELGFFKSLFGVSIIKQRIIPFCERHSIIKSNIDFYPLDKVEISIKPNNFYSRSQRLVRDMLTLFGCDLNKILVLDQAFAGNDPAKSFPFFDDALAIVVDRDPRDQYIFAKKKLLSRGRFMPTDTVNKFIQYYKLLRNDQPYKNTNECILNLQFEEMIYDYDNATKKIDNFLNVVNHQKKTIFKPEISVANTNLINKFPEFKRDIEIIERELPEYLFHFENYPNVKGSDKMFIGKSPLNKK